MFDLSVGETMFELVIATVMVCVTLNWVIVWVMGLIEDMVLNKKSTGGDIVTLLIAICFFVVFSVTLAIIIVKRYGTIV